MKTYEVPVYIAIEANSAEKARAKVIHVLTDDSFEWPLHLGAVCVGNEEEVYEPRKRL